MHLDLELTFFIVDTQGWGVSPRGAGYLFGSDVVAQVNKLCYENSIVVHGFHKYRFLSVIFLA